MDKESLQTRAVSILRAHEEAIGSDFLSELEENISNWRTGYDQMSDLYWITPKTPDKRGLRPPFNVLRFSHDGEFVQA